MIWWERRGSFPRFLFFQPGEFGLVRAMIRPIRQLNDPVLKALATLISPEAISGTEVQSLARDMFETLAQAGGVGLAAPQVGESVRLILAGSFPTEKNPDRPLFPMAVLVNPVIVAASEETEYGWEGCLSFLNLRVKVKRALAVTVDYLTLEGNPVRIEASGFLARVLQHEIDHLDGILTLDRAEGPGGIEEVVPKDDSPKSAAAVETT